MFHREDKVADVSRSLQHDSLDMEANNHVSTARISIYIKSISVIFSWIETNYTTYIMIWS